MAVSRYVDLNAVVTPHLLQNYMPIPETGCWLWLGGWDTAKYGKISKHGTVVCLAHRLFYAVHKGDLGDALVLHKCDTPQCVNPDHLFLGSTRDNTHDMFRKGRGRPRGKVIPPNPFFGIAAAPKLAGGE